MPWNSIKTQIFKTISNFLKDNSNFEGKFPQKRSNVPNKFIFKGQANRILKNPVKPKNLQIWFAEVKYWISWGRRHSPNLPWSPRLQIAYNKNSQTNVQAVTECAPSEALSRDSDTMSEIPRGNSTHRCGTLLETCNKDGQWEKVKTEVQRKCNLSVLRVSFL